MPCVYTASGERFSQHNANCIIMANWYYYNTLNIAAHCKFRNVFLNGEISPPNFQMACQLCIELQTYLLINFLRYLPDICLIRIENLNMNIL